MNTKRFLIILAVMALLLTLPNVASAQQLPPHVFVGMAMMEDGAAAPDGTMVSAWVGGAEVASATVMDGNYALIVDQGDQSFAGETITFQVGGMDAMETGMWMQGGGDELNLTSSGTMMAGKSITLNLAALSNSGQSGTAMLTEMGTMTQVVLTLSAGALQTDLVHIHSGQCGATLGGVDYGLNSFVGGSGGSTTMVDATLAMIQDGDHAINSHEVGNAGNYTSCVNVPAAAMVAMEPGATGVPGARGAAGPSGPAGASGSAGAKGATGSKGPSGPSGDAGPSGPAGSSGAAGNAGPPGPSGPVGAAGTAGPEGSGGSSGVLAIVGLILAIIALVGAGGVIVLSRRT